jgi:nucleotide-binding universal stress UspA family protein
MKILVPIDFSKNSIQALELALGLNRNQKSTIILVHIVELVYDFASQAAIAIDSMYKDSKKLLDDLEKKYASENINFIKIIEEGTASISIARISKQNEASLIVIGTAGAGGIRKLVMGSTTINLLKEAETPVLVVPADADSTQMRKLTMAIQYSNHEKSLFSQIILIQRHWDLELDFLHISEEDNFKDELAGKGLQEFLKEHFEIDSTVITNLVSGSTIEGINSYFEKNNENIIVMCHEHKSLWKHFIESSHSLAMAYQSKLPILVMN